MIKQKKYVRAARGVMMTFVAFIAISVQSAVALPVVPDFTGLVEQSKEWVVSIYSTKIVRDHVNLDPLLRRFFGFPPDQKTPQRERRISGLGSGLIISSDGYILTNAHVVEGAEDLQVELANDEKYTAEVIGFDKLTDIAIVKIDNQNSLIPAKISGEGPVKVGQWVIAIGSPLGLSHTVTAGIISAVSRDLPTDMHVSFIQTDAPVNPGNSGGPLINMQGEVIGINSQIISRTGSYSGYSLAIPIQLAMEVQQRLREEGTIERGRLGVVFTIINDDSRGTFGLPKDLGGALINDVIPNSGADKAGLRSGDIIVEYSDKEITVHTDLPRQVAKTKPGSEIDLRVWREGKLANFAVTIGKLQDDNQASNIEQEHPLGLVLSDVPDQARESLNIQDGAVFNGFAEGVEIMQELRRLQPGDVILAVVIEQRVIQIASSSDLRNRLKKISGGYIGFRVQRGKTRPFFINVNLDL